VSRSFPSPNSRLPPAESPALFQPIDHTHTYLHTYIHTHTHTSCPDWPRGVPAYDPAQNKALCTTGYMNFCRMTFIWPPSKLPVPWITFRNTNYDFIPTRRPLSLVYLTYRLITPGLVPNEEVLNCTSVWWQLSHLLQAAWSPTKKYLTVPLSGGSYHIYYSYMRPVRRDATELTERTGARENSAVETKVRSANFDHGESWQQAIKPIWPPFYLCCEQNQNSFVRMAWCLFIALKLHFVESVPRRQDHRNAINFHAFRTSEVSSMWEQ
jgi:hypothetical protein